MYVHSSSLADPADSDETHKASFVCLPRPDMVVIYNQFDVTCFQLADHSATGEGDHVLTLTTLWRCPNPLAKTSLMYHISLTECADTPPSASPAFEARFVEYGRDSSTDTFVSWRIGPLGSSVEQSTPEKILSTVTLPGGLRCLPASSRNNFWSAVAIDNGISFFITPLDDVGRDDGWGTLRFCIPHAEFRDGRSTGTRAMDLDLDVDRASGRVIIWWADEEYPERDSRTQFFILELVRGL